MISKRQVLAELDSRNSAAFVSLVKIIDASLKKFTGPSVVVSLPAGTTATVITQLIETYQAPAAGWNVQHNKGNDQHDGAWNQLEFS